jgi:arylsulfatase A-like enzyme
MRHSLWEGKPHQAIYSNEIGYGRGVDKFVNRSLEDFKDIDEIIDFINKSKQPFFLNINSVITHFPHFFLSSSRKVKNDNYKGILPKNREEYDLLLNNCFVELKKSCPIDFSRLPKEFISKNKYSTNEHKIITYLMYEKKREDLLFLEEIYSEAVVYLDRLLGKLFDFLKSSKLMENTIVVLTSDVGQTISEGLNLENGESEFNYGYSLNNEEVLKIPLMVYLPERHLNEAGKLYIEEKTSTIDLLPSILFTLGYKLEEDTSGLRIDFNNPHIPYRQFISGLSFRPHRGLEFYNISNKYIMFSSSNKSGVYNRYSGKTKFDLSFIQDLDLNSQKEELAKYQKSLPESFLKR